MTPVQPHPPRIASDLVRGNGVAALGDSITQSDGQNSTGLAGSGSWFVQACMASGGRMRFVRNAGVSGNRTDQMLARVQTDVVAFTPNWCFVLGGINSLRNLGVIDVYGRAISMTTIKADLTAIYTALRAAHIQPIPCTLTPHDIIVPAATRDALNAWIRWYGQTHGYPICDFEAATYDPAGTAGWISGYSSDNLHPTQTGVAAMAAKALADIAPLFPMNHPQTSRSGAGVSILTLGNFLADANLDGVADGWTGVNTAVNATPSLVADTHAFGKHQQLVVTVTGIKYFERDASGGAAWAVGNRLAFSGKVTTSGAVAGSLSITAKVTFASASGTPNQIVPIFGLIADVTDYVWYQEGVIPAGTTAVTIDLMVNSGTGTVQWAEVCVVNMTAQGFV